MDRVSEDMLREILAHANVAHVAVRVCRRWRAVTLAAVARDPWWRHWHSITPAEDGTRRDLIWPLASPPLRTDIVDAALDERIPPETLREMVVRRDHDRDDEMSRLLRACVCRDTAPHRLLYILDGLHGRGCAGASVIGDMPLCYYQWQRGALVGLESDTNFELAPVSESFSGALWLFIRGVDADLDLTDMIFAVSNCSLSTSATLCLATKKLITRADVDTQMIMSLIIAGLCTKKKLSIATAVWMNPHFNLHRFQRSTYPQDQFHELPNCAAFIRGFIDKHVAVDEREYAMHRRVLEQQQQIDSGATKS